MRFGVFILALAIRIAAIEATGANTVRFGDAGDYLDTARSVCTEQVYPERGNLPFFRPPGLPFFIAAVTGCEGSRVRGIKYALAACDAATVMVIFELGLLLFGSLAAWLAALAAALYPFFIFSTTDVRSEPLFMLLLTLSILLLLRGNAAGSGVAVALAALTRPTALLCLPLFALFAGYGVTGSRGRVADAQPRDPVTPQPRGRTAAVSLLIAGFLTLAPWVARNYLRFGELILVNDAGSYSVWHASHPDTRRIYDASSREELRRLEHEFENRTIHAVAAQVESRATTPNSRDREWRRLAIEDLRREPAESARFMARKAWLYWRPWLNPIEYGTRAVVASALILVTLFVLAAIGLWRHPLRNAVLVYFAVFWLAHVPHQVVMRYRIPFTDPLLLVFAAGAIASLRKADGDADSRDRSAAT
jgi:4-amino-4-deoxy-L-arabinose transferase-like glycosyltransferase